VSELAAVEIDHSAGGLGSRVLRILGEVDMSNASEVAQRIELLVPNDVRSIVLDLSGTTYLDSAGVQFLFRLAGRLMARRQKLRLLVPADAPIRALLELAGVAKIIPLDEESKDTGDAMGGSISP
jgi:anti-anti-sigma factor